MIQPGPNPFDADGVWLKTALHTHTNRTDGDLDPDRHVQHHEWMGFDVVAITDHWTLTSEPSTGRILVLQGAELAADPLAKGRYTEILAIGIHDIPEDPGGARADWEQVDNYLFKTFPDLSTAAANIAAQGGVAFVAHPYWSGLPPETVLEAEGVAGLELYNASAERETGRGDSSYIWDLALDRGRLLFGIATDDSHYPGFDIGDGWTMVRAADRSEEAVLQALATGSFYATNGPEIHDVRRDGGEIEVHCSAAASVVLRSGFERGMSVIAGQRARLEGARIVERDAAGAVTRARFHPEPDALTYARIQVNDERGRSAWTNPI
jgi:predicted metal-dependent phosphoesterase TrpH